MEQCSYAATPTRVEDILPGSPLHEVLVLLKVATLPSLMVTVRTGEAAVSWRGMHRESLVPLRFKLVKVKRSQVFPHPIMML